MGQCRSVVRTAPPSTGGRTGRPRASQETATPGQSRSTVASTRRRRLKRSVHRAHLRERTFTDEPLVSTATLRRTDRPTLHWVLLGLTLLSTFSVYFFFYAGGFELRWSPQLAARARGLDAVRALGGGDPRHPRDGALLLRALPRRRHHAAVLHPGAARVRHPRRGDPDPRADPEPQRARGHRRRRAAHRAVRRDPGAPGRASRCPTSSTLAPGCRTTCPGTPRSTRCGQYLLELGRAPPRRHLRRSARAAAASSSSTATTCSSPASAGSRSGRCRRGRSSTSTRWRSPAGSAPLVTMLNLIPIGQLDGGHLAYALLGPRAPHPRPGDGRAADLLGVLRLRVVDRLAARHRFVVRFSHPPVMHADEPLSPGRRWVCYGCAVALVLCVIPVPVRQVFASLKFLCPACERLSELVPVPVRRGRARDPLREVRRGGPGRGLAPRRRCPRRSPSAPAAKVVALRPVELPAQSPAADAFVAPPGHCPKCIAPRAPGRAGLRPVRARLREPRARGARRRRSSRRWERVLARWAEPAAHEAFLAGLRGRGLARGGGAALPDPARAVARTIPTAARGRDEVIRLATASTLAPGPDRRGAGAPEQRRLGCGGCVILAAIVAVGDLPRADPPRDSGHDAAPASTACSATGGALSAVLEGYEVARRAARRWRARSRPRSSSASYLLAEAGTGTGKTLAYLLPAVLSGRRVVISTATKTLQEQVFFKDVPLLRDRLGLAVRRPRT